MLWRDQGRLQVCEYEQFWRKGERNEQLLLIGQYVITERFDLWLRNQDESLLEKKREEVRPETEEEGEDSAPSALQ